jgi:hypothetical protein
MGQRIRIRNQAGQNQKNFIFAIKNLALDPGPDLIQIRNGPDTNPGFSKMPGSGFSEQGSKTLPESVKESWN